MKLADPQLLGRSRPWTARLSAVAAAAIPAVAAANLC